MFFTGKHLPPNVIYVVQARRPITDNIFRRYFKSLVVTNNLAYSAETSVTKGFETNHGMSNLFFNMSMEPPNIATIPE